MPSFLNSTKPNKIVLKSDLGIENPPTFLVKRMKFGELKRLARLMESFSDTESIMDKFDELSLAVDELIIDWRRMGDKVFGVDKASDFLEAAEIFEIITEVMKSAQGTGEEGNE